jgi:hypothetical protein
MKRVEWIRVLRCISALACISCADTLGLHDLVEGQDTGGGPAESASASASDGGEALTIEAGAATGTDLGDALSEASASGPPSSELTIVGVGDAAPSKTDTGPATPVTVVGAAPPAHDGGGTMQKPDGSAAGCSCGAAPCTVHSDGVGQTFEDCAPKGTHDETQALAACTAFTGKSGSCMIQSCPGGGGGPGKFPPGQAACSTGASVCDCWTFAGAEVGLVQSMTSRKCDPCADGGTPWN